MGAKEYRTTLWTLKDKQDWWAQYTAMVNQAAYTRYSAGPEGVSSGYVSSARDTSRNIGNWSSYQGIGSGIKWSSHQGIGSGRNWSSHQGYQGVTSGRNLSSSRALLGSGFYGYIGSGVGIGSGYRTYMGSGVGSGFYTFAGSGFRFGSGYRPLLASSGVYGSGVFRGGTFAGSGMMPLMRPSSYVKAEEKDNAQAQAQIQAHNQTQAEYVDIGILALAYGIKLI